MRRGDKIEKLFSSKLSGLEPEVPDFVWERIDNTLSADPAMQQKPVHKVALFRRLYMVSGIAASLLLGTFLLLNYNNDNGTANVFTNSLPEDLSKDIRDIKVWNKPKTIEPESHYTAIIPSVGGVLPSAEKQIKTEEQEHIISQADLSVYEGSNELAAENTSQKEIEKAIDESDLKDKIGQLEQLAKSENVLLADNANESSKKGNGFSISMGGRSGLSSSDDLNPGHQVTRLSDNLGAVNGLMPQLAVEGDKSVIVYQKEDVKIDHKLPISFGITASKRFGRKVSVETGVVYSYLSSSIKSVQPENPESIADAEQSGSQYFHYLGIPLYVNLNFLQLGKAGFYLSLGGMAQKDLYGKVKLQEVIRNFKAIPSIAEKVSQKNLQYSVMSSLGISYPIYRRLHIYTTLGVAYYFDAKNDYRTIYSDRKTQFNLNAGFKFDF